MPFARAFRRLFVPGIFCLLVIALCPPCPAAEPLRVGTWKTAQTIQPFYYGRFGGPDRSFTVLAFTNPADQKNALLAGSLDMCGTTIAHAIHSAVQGQPVRVVAALCNRCSALAVAKDGPVHKVADLKGRRIGYVPGTMHEILLRETLAKNGLSPERDVSLVRVDFFDMGLALARGGIDAFLSGEPFPTLAEMEGYGRILSYPYYGETVGDINAGMLVTEEMVKERPEEVLMLVRAHRDATEYLRAHPDEWLERASGFGARLDALKKAAPNMELAWDMDADFVKRVRALGERMQGLGIIERQPDYDKLIDLSFVNELRRKDAGHGRGQAPASR